MRFGMMAAAAACVVAAPADAIVRNFVLEGPYVGQPFTAGSYNGFTYVPFPFPAIGSFKVSGRATPDIIANDYLASAYNEAGNLVFSQVAILGSFTVIDDDEISILFQDEDSSLLRGSFRFAAPHGLIISNDNTGRGEFALGQYDVGGGLTLTIAPVPEPETWALMLVGFAAAGAALRRRQATVKRTFIPS